MKRHVRDARCVIHGVLEPGLLGCARGDCARDVVLAMEDRHERLMAKLVQLHESGDVGRIAEDIVAIGRERTP